MASDRGEGITGADAWNEYWRLTPEAAAHSAGGPQVEALERFWAGVFSGIGKQRATRRWLDFACGNGAVTQCAAEVAGASGEAALLVGLDNVPGAIEAFRTRHPAAVGVVADARNAPFPDRAFDVVASQFGLEYAGIGAIDEAARLVAPAGVLAAVLHRKDGALYRECETNFRAMGRVRDSRVLATAKEAFRRGAAALRGHGSRTGFQRAEERFAAAVTVVDGVLVDLGDQVAGGTVKRLYADLAHMYARLGAFDPVEVGHWADRMEKEVEAYWARMSAMLETAIDGAGLERAAALASARGLSVRIREAMVVGPDAGESAAWVLVCDRH